MCRRCIRSLLVVLGCALVFASVFPIFAFLKFPEPLQTALIASKIIMLPAGALCFMAATAIKPRKLRP